MKRIALLLAMSTVFVSACTSTKWVRTTVAEHHEFNVALEQLREKGSVLQQPYAHPHAMELSDLEKLLGDLTYVEKSGLKRIEKQSPVFQAAEVDRLAPVLVQTLATADAWQRIRFTSYNQGDFMIFSVSRKTEGVMFIEPSGRLNIAFNFINYNRQTSENTAFNPSFSTVDPLKIQTAETVLTVPATYAKQHEFESGKPAPMWIVADLEKLNMPSSIAPAPLVRSREEPPSAVLPRVEIKSPPAEETEPGQTVDDLLRADIKNKLKYLKELFNDGLITEADYTVKKQELLNSIK